MIWPWSRSQSRSGGFEAGLVAAAVSQATGVAVSAGVTGGLQTAAGLVSRSLSAATVDGDMGLLAPHVLASFGYDLVRHGQSLWRFDVGEDGRPRLTRAYASSDPVVSGGPEPDSWVYALTVPGPTATRTEWVSAAEVLHVRINESSYLPWRGQAPLAVAALTGRLAAELEQALGRESRIPDKRLVTVPQGTTAEQAEALRAKIESEATRVDFPTTTARGFGAGTGTAPQTDWRPQRLGHDFGTNDHQVYSVAMQTVLACCGVPAALAPGAGAAGPAVREAMRTFLTTLVQPWGALIAGEASRVLETTVTMRHHRLAAADVAAPARGVHILQEAGVDVAEAKMLVGWE